MIASVGVCTRPADQAVRSFRDCRRRVSARVAFMPISQSARERQAAAAPRPSYLAPGSSDAKPLRIASRVIDCSQSRRVGFWSSRNSTISRKISSPSRPASQAFTTASTSSRCSSLPMVRMRSL